jgi:carboxymethylenebutenolidase
MSDKEITRRAFVKTGITAGFALAVQPIAAWAVSTDTKGLEAGSIQVPIGSEKMPAYWARPAGKKNLPVIVVVHEIFGVHEHIQDVCRRLAKDGFLAIAPDLFFRQGDATKIKDVSEVISKIVSKTPMDKVLTDIDATVAFAGASGFADIKKLSITGFCWGGRTTWLYAAKNPAVKAGVAFYGPLVGAQPPMTPQAPVDIAADLKVPILGLYGGKDGHITPEAVEQMRMALKKGHSGSEIKVYGDAEHGFFADYRPSYNKADANDAYKRLKGWLKTHGAV